MLQQFCTYLIDPRIQKCPGCIGFFIFIFNFLLFLKGLKKYPKHLKISQIFFEIEKYQKEIWTAFCFTVFFVLTHETYFFQNWTLMNREWLRLPGWSTNYQSPTNVCLKFCVVIWKKLLQNPTKI